MTAVTQAGKVRVAVVGTGEFGRNHARVYREIHNAELVGVYDKDSARAQAAASEFRTHAFAALDELAGRADAASVAVPTVDHAAIGCRLMEMGLDVIVEKPMAKSLAEADALIAAARRHHPVGLSPKRSADSSVPRLVANSVQEGRRPGNALSRSPTDRGAQHGQSRDAGAGGHADLRTQDAVGFRALQHHIGWRLEGRSAKDRRASSTQRQGTRTDLHSRP